MTTDDAAAWVTSQNIPGIDLAKFKAAGISGMALARMTPAQLQKLGVSAADCASVLMKIKAAFPGGGKPVAEITADEAVEWLETQSIRGIDLAKFKAAGITGMALARMTPAELQTFGMTASEAGQLVSTMQSTLHNFDEPAPTPTFLQDKSSNRPGPIKVGSSATGGDGDAPQPETPHSPVFADDFHVKMARGEVVAPPDSVKVKALPKKVKPKRQAMPKAKPTVPEGPSQEEIDVMEAEQMKMEEELEKTKKAKRFGVVRVRKKMRKHKAYNPEEEAAEARRRRELMQLNTNSKMNDMLEAEMAFMTSMQGISALDYLAKYCILSEAQLKRYSTVFNSVDLDRDGMVNHKEVEFGIRAVNNSMLTNKEVGYVDTVLDVRGTPEINFRMFAVICALSERVAALDVMVKTMINKMDTRAMEQKMQGCKDMFYLLDEKEDGFVEMEMLVREVRAGQITQEHEDLIVNKFSENGKCFVDFLDFLTYIPLFMEIHDTINSNPLDLDRYM